MENLNKIVIINRKSTKALNLSDLGSVEVFKNWKGACEDLRIAISEYSNVDRAGNDSEKELEACFVAYRAVLKFFENKAEGFKLKPVAQDISAIRDVSGKYAKPTGSVDGKEFLPMGKDSFRKALEDFISDRCEQRTAKTARELEAEKKARREAKKAAKAAAKAAEAAKPEEPKDDETKTEEPKTEEPKTKAVKTEAAKTEEPKTEIK